MYQAKKGQSKGDSWQTQHAKAHFSEVIRKAAQEGDQFITHRGEEVAVVLSKSRYEELMTPSDSLLDFFYSVPDEVVELETERSLDLPRQCDI